MAKYIFTQDFKTGTYIPQGQGRPSVMVSFKKGDTIDGTFFHNEGQSESDFVTTQTSYGEVRIPFGGRAGSPISVYSQNSSPTSDTSNKNSAKQSATFFTPKNVIIGVLIIGSILGGLKLFKVI